MGEKKMTPPFIFTALTDMDRDRDIARGAEPNVSFFAFRF
jgi:hypothetical protein